MDKTLIAVITTIVAVVNLVIASSQINDMRRSEDFRQCLETQKRVAETAQNRVIPGCYR